MFLEVYGKDKKISGNHTHFPDSRVGKERPARTVHCFETWSIGWDQGRGNAGTTAVRAESSKTRCLQLSTRHIPPLDKARKYAYMLREPTIS